MLLQMVIKAQPVWQLIAEHTHCPARDIVENIQANRYDTIVSVRRLHNMVGQIVRKQSGTPWLPRPFIRSPDWQQKSTTCQDVATQKALVAAPL